MPSCNNILVVIVALVLSAQAMPPNAGGASYTYNPDSIAQNEKILRLFLCLASGTANHLIRLKNAAKLHRESTPRPNDDQPALRIQLPDDGSDREIADRGLFVQKRRPHYSSDRNRDREAYTEDLEGPYMPARRNSEVSPSEENDQRNENLSPTRDNQENSKHSPPSKERHDKKGSLSKQSQIELHESPIVAQQGEESEFLIEPIEIESRMMFNEEVNNTSGHDKENSIGKVMPGVIPQAELALAPHGGSFILNQTTDRPDVDGETTDESSTMASQHEVKINASGSSDRVQNEESGLFSRDLGAAGNNSQESSVQDLSATEKTDEDLNRILENPPKSMENAVSRQDLPLIGQTRNDGLDIVHQGLPAASQLQPGSPEATDLGLSSSEHRGNEIIGIAPKALEGASNLQSRSSDIANISQRLTSNGDSGNQTTGIVRDDSSAALNLQSVTSGLTNVTQGLLSIGQHGNQVLDETHQALETASSSQSGLSGMLDSTLEPSSSGQSWNEMMGIARRDSGVVSNVQPGNLLTTGEILGHSLNGQSKSQSAEIDEDSGIISTVQPGLSITINATEIPARHRGIQVAGMTNQIFEAASSLQSGSSGIINTTYGPSSNSQSGNQTPIVVHKISDAGTNPRSEGAGKFAAPRDQGSNDFLTMATSNGIHEMSKFHKSHGFLFKSAGGDSWNQLAMLENSNQTISAIADATKDSSGSMIKAADGIGTIIRHANPTADLTSNAVDVSRTSSRLSMPLPLFRSFPDFKEEPSLIEDEEAVEDEISESQVNDFAHKFVDALRPVQSKQRVQVTFA